jgi:hypothetical protein
MSELRKEVMALQLQKGTSQRETPARVGMIVRGLARSVSLPVTRFLVVTGF